MVKLFLYALLLVASCIAPVAKAYAQEQDSLTTPENDNVQQVVLFDRNTLSVDTSASIFVCSPLRTPKITSHFGMRRHPVTGNKSFHNGVDLIADNPVVMAIYDGMVVQAGEQEILGRFICIDHGGVYSIYGHLSACLVDVGNKVRAGQDIGIMGRTGRVTGVHLHFSVRISTQYIDPIKFLLALQKQFLNY
ncbi:M23 family metallopeptidase [Sphingobacterium deserti]|uniref:Peptidase M23 n=1 Tax=Sphingobacterium deserti TaxID=1229276 RepID=A0A0B8T578_9SPHI|nr:M23 family metallopeptidase [Sphingobacterium deserti]KGE12629.1 peptidase M23 [Sphingobacterium deserti]